MFKEGKGWSGRTAANDLTHTHPHTETTLTCGRAISYPLWQKQRLAHTHFPAGALCCGSSN